MGDDEADDARDAPPDWVACPTCRGTGLQLPVNGPPCVTCAGSGLVTADVARAIVESGEMEAGPTGEG